MRNKKTRILLCIYLFLFSITIKAQVISRVLEYKDKPMYGNDVIQVQKLLKQYGFNIENINGYYENNTRNAIMLFQKYWNIEQNGKVDKQTWSLLFDTSQNDLAYSSERELYLRFIKYLNINTNKINELKKIEISLPGYSTEGGIVKILKNGNAIYYIEEIMYGEMSQVRTYYYLMKDRNSFIRKETYYYPETFEFEHAKIETRYYLDKDGREKYEITNGKFVRTDEEFYRILNRINQSYMEENSY